MTIKDLINQLDNDTTLVMKLDSFLETREQRRPPDGCYHPSMAGDCARSIWYYQVGYPAIPFSGEVMRKMNNGTDAHKRIQGYFEEMGILAEAEKSVKYSFSKPAPKVTVAGNLDGIIKDGEKKVFEFKTAMSWSYNQVVKNLSPLSGHFEQWCLYSYGVKIWEGIILYENKDTQALFPIVVKFDMTVFNGLIDKFRLVQKHIKLKVPPDRPAKGMSDKMCLYCNYKDICWERK